VINKETMMNSFFHAGITYHYGSHSIDWLLLTGVFLYMAWAMRKDLIARVLMAVGAIGSIFVGVVLGKFV
jgi:hypothetical protein